jgi:hypothetical protein
MTEALVRSATFAAFQDERRRKMPRDNRPTHIVENMPVLDERRLPP